MNEILQQLRDSIAAGAPQHARAAAQRALALGLDPLHAIDAGCTPGMQQVGDSFARHQIFLPDVMMASEAMKAAIAVLEPEMKRAGVVRQSLGRVILGTVQGDIHEIGKGLVAILLAANGFEVHDLGVGVSAETFVNKARELHAGVVGVSALLTTTMTRQRDVVQALDAAALRPAVRIVVGGAPVTRQWAAEIGADGYAKDAMSAVALVRALLSRDAA